MLRAGFRADRRRFEPAVSCTAAGSRSQRRQLPRPSSRGRAACIPRVHLRTRGMLVKLRAGVPTGPASTASLAVGRVLAGQRSSRGGAMVHTHLTALAERLRVGPLLFADADDNVHKPSVVLQPLLGAPRQVLLLVSLLRDLRRLTAHLAGTCQRAVNLACARERRRSAQPRACSTRMPRRDARGHRGAAGVGRPRTHCSASAVSACLVPARELPRVNEELPRGRGFPRNRGRKATVGAARCTDAGRTPMQGSSRLIA